MNLIKAILLFVFFAYSFTSAQDEIEIFIIDSYVTPEIPHTLIISFFTTDSATAKVEIDNKYFYDVSSVPELDHEFKLAIDGLKFDSLYVPYKIIAINKNGVHFESEVSGFELPSQNLIQKDSSPGMFTFCIGGVVYLLPSLTYVFENGQNYLSLTKEMPLFSFLDITSEYPVGTISLEYAHIFEAETRNFLRIGYKHFFEFPGIEYLSIGLNGFTDFLGFNGLSPEVTAGFFKIQNAFTIYGRYRYNFKPSGENRKFHEISIGLFAYFFSYNL